MSSWQEFSVTIKLNSSNDTNSSKTIRVMGVKLIHSHTTNKSKGTKRVMSAKLI